MKECLSIGLKSSEISFKFHLQQKFRRAPSEVWKKLTKKLNHILTCDVRRCSKISLRIRICVTAPVTHFRLGRQKLLQLTFTSWCGRGRRCVLNAAWTVRRGCISWSCTLGRGHGSARRIQSCWTVMIFRVPPQGSGVTITFSTTLRLAFVRLFIAMC